AGGEPGNRLYDLLERLKEAILRSVIDGLLALADYFRQVNLGNQAFQLLRRTANEYPGEARVKAALAKLAAVMPEAKVFYAEKWESTLTTLPAPPVAPATTLPPTTKSEADLLREMRTRLVKYVQNYAKTLGYYAAEGSGATSVGILTIDRPYDAREEEQCKKKIREEALYKLHETLDCRPDELTVYVKTGTKADQIMVYCSVKAPTTAKPATKAAAKPASKIEFSKIMYDPIDTLAQKLECVYVGKDDFGGMEYENKSTGTSLYGQMRPEWDHPIAYSCNWTTPTISFYGISVGDLLKSSIKKLPISDTQSDLEFYAGEMTEEGNYHFYSGGSNSHLLVADQDGIITEISMRYYIPGAQD
ncbi:MAG: hypothetical protein LBJ11_09295, partial [Oscillospiraceae bacterium]|nr:hypothetical protein [Oscillospiraceae bacterium]